MKLVQFTQELSFTDEIVIDEESMKLFRQQSKLSKAEFDAQTNELIGLGQLRVYQRSKLEKTHPQWSIGSSVPNNTNRFTA